MTYKTFLLGAAAALMSVTGARAADAVMAPEPEPVEYVRVCDAYGAGFFYIPGTETCLQISGYVWYQVGASTDQGPLDTPTFNGFAGGGWDKNVRARVNFDARSETEWGTLRSYIRLQANWNGVGDGPLEVDQAWIALGGLRVGYTESAWAETYVGGISTSGSHSDNAMGYGDQQRALMQYNFESNGFFGVLSLEDDALAGEGYMPDVVGVVGYASGWGGLWARLGYSEGFDGSARPLPLLGNNSGGFGASAGVEFNVPNMEGSSLRLIGYYADGDHSYGNLHGPASIVFGGNGNSEWSALASYGHTFSDKVSASVAFQYFNNFYQGLSDVGSGRDGYAAELSLAYTPFTDFEVRTEVQYDKIENLDGSLSGYLRFTRSFGGAE
jgi:hypothetical protein